MRFAVLLDLYHYLVQCSCVMPPSSLPPLSSNLPPPHLPSLHDSSASPPPLIFYIVLLKAHQPLLGCSLTCLIKWVVWNLSADWLTAISHSRESMATPVERSISIDSVLCKSNSKFLRDPTLAK
ncbi:hypothetical protein DPEC_G00031730 [Dallia pectoralis]|uniref:Uncharacterized protein n=1 Tax=Dallia pectoralis TaxID=75939 RepID=A0ACC2HCJ7_DALPE|nr:hypothetical protein DPEC_G00031730 [Dallia pectoralis]